MDESAFNEVAEFIWGYPYRSGRELTKFFQRVG